MKSESTYVLEIVTILNKAKDDMYSSRNILDQVDKHLKLLELEIEKNNQKILKIQEKNNRERSLMDKFIIFMQEEAKRINEFSYETLKDKGNELGLDEKNFLKLLEKLKFEGHIFEPRKNIFKILE